MHHQVFYPDFDHDLTRYRYLLNAIQHIIKNDPLFEQLKNPSFDVLSFFQEVKNKYKNFIIVGIGGSILGIQALTSFLNNKKLIFLDNVDPFQAYEVIKGYPLNETFVLTISKSGQSTEPLSHLLSLITLYKTQNLPISSHFACITQAHSMMHPNNALREIARQYNMPVFNHPQDIGGRFSVFTLVGLVPAFLAGLSIEGLLEGAQIAIHDLKEYGVPLKSALWLYDLYTKKNINQLVVMPYCERLILMVQWFRQLWAESLGKDGHGITPIPALGTVDQHSQLQLYLDGPKDKAFTLMTVKIPEFPCNHDEFDSTSLVLKRLKGLNMAQVMKAEQAATIDVLKEKAPLKSLYVADFSEKTAGYIMMNWILETLSMAALLEVNPWDQPAVETKKKLVLDYLKR